MDEPEFGDPRLPAHFWSKVQQTDTCWLWTAGLNKGYGRFGAGKGNTSHAHRWAYLTLVGPIDAKLHIDHLCRTPACVRPSHLEPVTARENTRRGNAPSSVVCRTNVCKSGRHSMDDAYDRAALGWRRCRHCQRENEQRSRERKKATESPYQPNPTLPAGDGWCEAIVRSGDYCYAKARYERDGHRACGLHRPGVRANFPAAWGSSHG